MARHNRAPAGDLGLGLAVGDRHYRSYVGFPQDYDLTAAMTFNLLTTLGLRQHHTVLDVGCGSLRIGRLLIPYLNTGNYTGIEPNKWLVEEGIRHETGRAQIRIKQPHFHFAASAQNLASDLRFDFAVAQSIFSHCGPNLVRRWLGEISGHLAETGALAATFLIGSCDHRNAGWTYPGVVSYTITTMKAFAEEAGLRCVLIDWRHPRQQWALYVKPAFDTSWFAEKALSWNTLLDSQPKLWAG